MEGQSMTLRELHLTQDAPWPGPAAYAERDASFFHGRAAETAELHRLIHAEPVCVLYALSGLGKTSLLQAGVFPRLRADGWLPVRIRLDHRDLDDDGNPVPPLPAQVLDLVAQAAQAYGISVPEWTLTDDSLTTAFHERGERLWGAREDEPVTPVLVLDQFEECWTQTRDRPAARARAEALLGEVAALIDWRGNGPLQPAPVRIVFSLREDQLAPLDALRPLFPGLRRARLRLLPFTAAQATEVVEIPGDCLLDDGAAEAIVSTFASRDVDRPIADPALLSIFCWRLNEDRRSPERHADTITAARAIALRGEFVQQFYDAAFALLPPEQSMAARRFIETDLIDAAGYRSSAGFEHAEKKYGLGAGSLETLVDARLLHPVDRSGGHRHVELVHDRIGEEAMRQRTLREEADSRAEEAAATIQLRNDLARSRLRLFILVGLSILSLVAMVLALALYKTAQQAQRDSEYAKNKALDAKNSTAKLMGFMVVAVCDLLGRRGSPDIAKFITDEAFRFYEANPPEEGDIQGESNYSAILINQGQYLLSQNDSVGALLLFRRQRDIAERLAKNAPDNGILEANVAVSWSNIGDAQTAAKQLDDALLCYEEALKIITGALQRHQEIEVLRRVHCETLIHLGRYYFDTGQHSKAIGAFQSGLAVAQSMTLQYPASDVWSRNLFYLHFKISESLETLDQLGALKSAEEALKSAERLLKIWPSNPSYESDLRMSRDRVESLKARGKY
jgi:tetratricopeptide (TPR) repeat protein